MKPAANKIIHVPRRFAADEWGGTETIVLEISRQQQRGGWHPGVFTSMALARRRSESIGGVPVRRFRHCYTYLGLSEADKNVLDKKGGNLLSLALFNALRREKDVRLFHAHALKRVGGMTLTAARLQKKPFVVSLHGGVFDVPTAELGSMLKPIESKIEWGKPFGALFSSRRVLNAADLVICVGQSEMDQARRELTHDRLAWLPNGVDCAKFATGDGAAFRAQHGIPSGAFLALNVSRLDSQKNQMLAVAAFRKLRAQHPLAFLVLIGPESQPDYVRKLREFIDASQLADRVKILPGLRNDNPELVQAFHACDVFVLPSVHEPFGIVVLEAWSARKPVIVDRVGGLQDLVEEGETGFFIDPNAADAAEDMAAKLSLLAADPNLRWNMGDAGWQEATAKYDWTQIGHQLETLYQRAEEYRAGRP